MLKIRIHPSRKSDFFFKRENSCTRGRRGEEGKDILHQESCNPIRLSKTGCAFVSFVLTRSFWDSFSAYSMELTLKSRIPQAAGSWGFSGESQGRKSASVSPSYQPPESRQGSRLEARGRSARLCISGAPEPHVPAGNGLSGPQGKGGRESELNRTAG